MKKRCRYCGKKIDKKSNDVVARADILHKVIFYCDKYCCEKQEG